jgi:hypothetical protein
MPKDLTIRSSHLEAGTNSTAREGFWSRSGGGRGWRRRMELREVVEVRIV